MSLKLEIQLAKWRGKPKGKLDEQTNDGKRLIGMLARWLVYPEVSSWQARFIASMLAKITPDAHVDADLIQGITTNETKIRENQTH